MEKLVVFIPVIHQGHTDLMNVDLLFQDGAPLAVLEWGDYQDGTSIPSVAVQLEPKWLHRVTGMDPATHMYERPISSPVPLPRSTADK